MRGRPGNEAILLFMYSCHSNKIWVHSEQNKVVTVATQSQICVTTSIDCPDTFLRKRLSVSDNLARLELGFARVPADIQLIAKQLENSKPTR